MVKPIYYRAKLTVSFPFFLGGAMRTKTKVPRPVFRTWPRVAERFHCVKLYQHAKLPGGTNYGKLVSILYDCGEIVECVYFPKAESKHWTSPAFWVVVFENGCKIHTRTRPRVKQCSSSCFAIIVSV